MAGANDLGFTRYLLSTVRQAVDAGELAQAEELVELARHQISDDDRTAIADELRLTVLLERTTILQHRCELDRAQAVAEQAEQFAKEQFGAGIQTGRAQVRLHYVWEAQRRYVAALEANFRLADELREQPGAEALALGCLTRALACAVKNADRTSQDRARVEGAIVGAGLDLRNARESLGFFYFWNAMAEMRQNNRNQARRLLFMADRTAFPLRHPTWRWRVLRQLALAKLLQITPEMESQGQRLFQATRNQAATHGYRYLVQSMQDVFRDS
jgi:hypothetical protein